MKPVLRFAMMLRGLRALARGTVAGALLLALAVVPAHAQEWTYTAREGDNLWDLASEFLVSMGHWREFRALNDVPNPRHMQPGTVVRFPARWLRVQPAPVEVIASRGAARVRDAAGRESPARVGMRLGPGAVLVAGGGASAELRFADGSRMLVRPDSEVRMDDLGVYGRSGALVDSRARLQRGRVEVEVSPGGDDRLEIITPSASALVRGTRFRVAAEEFLSRAEVEAGSVRVDGAGGGLTVTAGNGTLVRRGEPPAPPRPLLPMPVLDTIPERIERRRVRLRWAPVTGASGYRVQVATVAEVAVLLLDVPTGAADLQLPDLADGRYAIHVRAVDAAGLEGLDATRVIELDARPEPPATLEPRPGETVRVESPSFRWSEPADAVAFRLQVSAQADFARTALDRDGLAATRLETDMALEPGEWFWRVASVDAAGEQGPWSDAQPFTVRLAPPAPGEAQATTGEEDVQLRWQSAQPGQTYEVEIAATEAFADDARIEATADPQLVLPVPENDLWFRVRVVDTDGYRGPWGTPNRIEAPKQEPWWLLAVPLLILLL